MHRVRADFVTLRVRRPWNGRYTRYRWSLPVHLKPLHILPLAEVTPERHWKISYAEIQYVPQSRPRGSARFMTATAAPRSPFQGSLSQTHGVRALMHQRQYTIGCLCKRGSMWHAFSVSVIQCVLLYLFIQVKSKEQEHHNWQIGCLFYISVQANKIHFIQNSL